MKTEKIKNLILKSLTGDEPDAEVVNNIREATGDLSFSEGFTDRVLDRIFTRDAGANRDIEFLQSLNKVFYRIALTGIAAIIFLVISIYISQGSLSLDSFLGLGDIADESIVYILTGN
ncbi:MAG: hypothetical protein KBG40_08640 [Bacteroidales bacterium]|nr:hypothetical protein [Bacteroidales bacterium]